MKVGIVDTLQVLARPSIHKFHWQREIVLYLIYGQGGGKKKGWKSSFRSAQSQLGIFDNRSQRILYPARYSNAFAFWPSHHGQHAEPKVTWTEFRCSLVEKKEEYEKKERDLIIVH